MQTVEAVVLDYSETVHLHKRPAYKCVAKSIGTTNMVNMSLSGQVEFVKLDLDVRNLQIES